MKQTVVLLLTVVLMVSCAKDNDVGLDEHKGLEGNWTLMNVSCYCAFGDNPDFSGHKIAFEGNNLSVENLEENQFLTNAEGTFTLKGNVITLKNGQQYTYVVKQNILELTFVDEPNIADDELFLEYMRSI